MKDARVALDVGLHIPRRHQTNLVTKLRKFTRPIMGGGARLHADKARRQRLEELQHLAAPKLLPNDDLLGRVDPVNLKHVLGDIQTDRGDLRCWERAPSTTSGRDSCTAANSCDFADVASGRPSISQASAAWLH